MMSCGGERMANTSETVYNIVREHGGIKCAEVARIANTPLNSTSGTLTALKHRGMVFNEDALWHATNSVHTIKRTLNDIHESSNVSLDGWAEGYVSALANYNIINENEFDELIEYIRNN